MNRLTWGAVVLMVIISGSTSGVAAQQQGTVWSGMKTSGLQTVYVRDTAEHEMDGKLLALSPETLVLLTGSGERTVARADVARIQMRDSLKNGTIIGAVVGFGLGLWSGGISDCPARASSGSCDGMRVAFVGLSTGLYAGLGAGIDALVRGRTTIYAVTH